MKDDATLLQSYARNRTEGDFAELVGRHVRATARAQRKTRSSIL